MISVDVDYSGVMAGLDKMPALVVDAIASKMRVLTVDLQGYVIADKLQGQVLNHRSGALSRSIQQDVATDGDKVTGLVFSSGDVKYAARHEYGFDGEEDVKAHQRIISQVFGRPVDPITVQVASFTRHAHTPERSFLRSSLAEKSEEIVAGINAAAMFGAKEALGQ